MMDKKVQKMIKAEGVERGSAYKGEGEGRQDRHHYLLADPRLVEAHNFSTVVPHKD